MKIKKFISYSDQREDLILSIILKKVKKGFYIDVGANDDTEGNVTKHFYDDGWRGINIEPLKKEYLSLKKNRLRDINLNVGISNKEGIGRLYVAGGLSSFIEKKKRKKSTKIVCVKLKTLDQIANKYIKNKTVHFCKIDVEGFERFVLEGINFKKLRPWVFCIESTYPNTKIPSYFLWEEILKNNGYVFVYEYGVNRYYIDSKRKREINFAKKIGSEMKKYTVLDVVDKNINKEQRIGSLVLAPYRFIKNLLKNRRINV